MAMAMAMAMVPAEQDFHYNAKVVGTKVASTSTELVGRVAA
jgi:hypothetical protein